MLDSTNVKPKFGQVWTYGAGGTPVMLVSPADDGDFALWSAITLTRRPQILEWGGLPLQSRQDLWELLEDVE